jgi:two-component system response regulator NreC
MTPPPNIATATIPAPVPARSRAVRRVGVQTAPRISVLLADDHAMMRRTLLLLLEREEGVEVYPEASDLAAVAEQAKAIQPHVLVLYLSTPGGAGIQAIARLRKRTPDTQIVVLGTEENPVFVQQALAAGAVGFVARDTVERELPAAVRAAARGELYLSPSVAARLDTLRRSHTESRLSAREVEVLRLIALGYTSVEVAGRLHLSPRTVETHRAHILGKLGLSTRAQLVAYALAQGLLETESLQRL